MVGSLKQIAPVALAAVTVFFFNLGGPALWDEDEPRNATCAREMLERGDWLVPTFNGQLRTDKPILIYWLTMTAYRVFGVNEFAARFWSATLSVGTVLLTSFLGRRLYRSGAGMWSGVVLATCLLFGVSARAATTDATLIFFTTLGLVAFIDGNLRARSESKEVDPRPATLDLRTTALTYFGLGMAVLAKGPSGFVLPFGVMAVWSTLQTANRRCDSAAITTDQSSGMRWKRLLALVHPKVVLEGIWGLRPLTGGLITAALALPWYVAVGLKTGGAWPAGFLGKHNVGRFLSTMEGHGGPVVYYLPIVLLGVLPWSWPLVIAFRDLWRRWKTEGNLPPGEMALCCWIGVYVVFFSFSGTKLPSYVLPCFPALAVLMGKVVDGWASESRSEGVAVFRTFLAGGCTVGLVLLVGTPLVAREFLPGEERLGIIGFIPLAGFAAALWMRRQGQSGTACRIAGATAVLFLAGLFGVVGERVADHQISRSFGETLRGRQETLREVAVWNHFPPGLVFYAADPVHVVSSAEEAAAFLRVHPQGYVVVRGESWSALKPLVSDEIQPVKRLPMFLRRGREALLVGRTGTEPENEHRVTVTTAANHGTVTRK